MRQGVSFTEQEAKMPMHPSISQETFLRVAQVFDWATKKHFVTWFTGENRPRHRRIEILLKRLSDNGKLRVADYGRKKIYITPRRRNLDNHQIEHGLGVTEGLVRFLVSDRSGIVIPERCFHAQVRPEFGIMYGESTLLYEFCTKDNSHRMNVLKRKVNAYQTYAGQYVFLFVLDRPREEVKEVVKKLQPKGMFMFTDYETFRSVPLGEQLTAKIYLWEDGHEYQLRSG
jgi:hypothetical protein